MFYSNNNNTMDPISSKQIIADYVNYRLESKGYLWPNSPPLPAPNRVNKTMRLIGDEFEERYKDIFDDMCNQLHITPSTAYPTFIGIVHELYADGIKWGRIVALFAFGGALAVHCVDKEMPDIVDSIVDWVATYVDTNLHSWIIENGGWNGFVSFYENSPERAKESPWPSFRTVCGIAAGALGMITLGAILSNR